MEILNMPCIENLTDKSLDKLVKLKYLCCGYNNNISIGKLRKRKVCCDWK
jgi:hypothetical protein